MRWRYSPPPRSSYGAFRSRSERRVERAALDVSDRLATQARNDIRQDFLRAGLGRLNRVVDAGSDKKKGRIRRRANGGFSASGWVFLRNSRNDRTVGAIISATEGSDIRPVKGSWLWIATSEIPKRAARFKMTPARYVTSGLDRRIGPLEFVPGRHGGEALLVVKNVTVDRFGRSGKARRLPRRGRIGETRERRDFIVAFVGIRRTTRTAQVDVQAFMRAVQSRAPALVRAHLSGISNS